MTLTETGKAIGSVTKLLSDHLNNRTGYNIMVGRPTPPSSNITHGPGLNLFLYEAGFDASMRNLAIDERRPTPLWLSLKYLLTAFDSEGSSDSIEAHGCLGEGLRALQESNFLTSSLLKDKQLLGSLGDNPEPLKITFDNAPADLLSKLMQGPDEKYRFSIGFEVRPVMIATAEEPSYSLLVGMDYTTDKMIGEKGVVIPVLPMDGPVLESASPTKFQMGEVVTILGRNLGGPGLSVRLGDTTIEATAQSIGSMQFKVDESWLGGDISAGSMPICVVRTLSTGKKRTSNMLIGNLVPTLYDVDPISLTPTDPEDDSSSLFGTVSLTGILLGRENDDIAIAMYQNGKVVEVFDGFNTSTDQRSSSFSIPRTRAVPPGKYRFILVVNGQQARRSPEVELS